MSYRIENRENEGSIIFDGFEDGLSPSPYSNVGMPNIRNFNTVYYPGVAYVNYKRLAATINSVTLKAPTFYTQSNVGLIYILDNAQNIVKQSSTGSSTFNQLSGNTTSSAAGNGIGYWNGYLFSATNGLIDICGTGSSNGIGGSGDSGITSSHWNSSATPIPNGNFFPLGNPTSVTFTGTVAAGVTSAVLSSYVDPSGSSQTGAWLQPTGVYQMVLNCSGTPLIVNASFTFNSTAVTWNVPVLAGTTASASVTRVTAIFTTPTVLHQMYVSANSTGGGSPFFFTNGQYVGSLSTNSGSTFNLGNPNTWQFIYNNVTLPQDESAVWITELYNQLVIAGGVFNRIYFYDIGSTTSSTWQSYVQVPEPIDKIISIDNYIIIFTKQKGNIYMTDGSIVKLIGKIPDYITSLGGNSSNSVSVIDPVWTIGGIMNHRKQVWFQALGTDAAGNNYIAGIFSLDIAGDTGIMNFESQNSFGLISSSTQSSGLLINNDPSTNGNDSYYSAWTNGVGSTGGIDYNNTTLWSGNEPMFETQIVPCGTYSEPVTFSNFEFKLDQPMKSGDSITLYARGSLSDSYVQIGTTTTTTLSDLYTPLNFQRNQWVQFMGTVTCNSSASSSSFMRIRQLRVRTSAPLETITNVGSQSF